MHLRSLRRLNSEYYLKSAVEMAELFPDYPQALANTLEIAERCRFELDYGLQDLPHFYSARHEQQRLPASPVSRRYSTTI